MSAATCRHTPAFRIMGHVRQGQANETQPTDERTPLMTATATDRIPSRAQATIAAATSPITWLGAAGIFVFMMSGFGLLAAMGVAAGADASDALGYLCQMFACAAPAAFVGSLIWHAFEFYREERELAAARRVYMMTTVADSSRQR